MTTPAHPSSQSVPSSPASPAGRGDTPRPVARAVALYLPQFHPVVEIDQWWEPGFTEWTNVAKARPLFFGHRQPRLPADLGFYDLRIPEVREAQADMAQAAGIEAFCYWHYWFGHGVRMLDLPFREVLRTGSPSISFCLGWANESWTGTWVGQPSRILIEQTYPGVTDLRSHFDSLLPAFEDSRYMRVNGRPVFHVYRPVALPDPAQFVDLWQRWAKDAGLDGLYLVAGSSGGYREARQHGFDATWRSDLLIKHSPRRDFLTRLRHSIFHQPLVYRYSDEPALWPSDSPESSHLQPCIFPNWDTTPRSGRRGMVLTGATPEKFRIHVQAAVQRVSDRPAEERLIWINSWNEWAEGNYLEPDSEYGQQRLRVLAEELLPPAPGASFNQDSSAARVADANSRRTGTGHE